MAGACKSTCPDEYAKWSVIVRERFLWGYLEISTMNRTIPVAARCKAWVCEHLFAGNAGSNPRRGHGCLSLVFYVVR